MDNDKHALHISRLRCQAALTASMPPSSVELLPTFLTEQLQSFTIAQMQPEVLAAHYTLVPHCRTSLHATGQHSTKKSCTVDHLVMRKTGPGRSLIRSNPKELRMWCKSGSGEHLAMAASITTMPLNFNVAEERATFLVKHCSWLY